MLSAEQTQAAARLKVRVVTQVAAMQAPTGLPARGIETVLCLWEPAFGNIYKQCLDITSLHKISSLRVIPIHGLRENLL